MIKELSAAAEPRPHLRGACARDGCRRWQPSRACCGRRPWHARSWQAPEAAILADALLPRPGGLARTTA
jgi:hypothetical protein